MVEVLILLGVILGGAAILRVQRNKRKKAINKLPDYLKIIK